MSKKSKSPWPLVGAIIFFVAVLALVVFLSFNWLKRGYWWLVLLVIVLVPVFYFLRPHAKKMEKWVEEHDAEQRTKK